MGITAVTRGSIRSSHWLIRVVGVDLTVADETTRPRIRPLRPTGLPPLLALRIRRMASVGLMPDRQIPLRRTEYINEHGIRIASCSDVVLTCLQAVTPGRECDGLTGPIEHWKARGDDPLG